MHRTVVLGFSAAVILGQLSSYAYGNGSGLVTDTRSKSEAPVKRDSLKWTWLHGETVGNQHTNEVEILFDDEKPSDKASKKHGFFYPGSRAGTTWWQVSDGTVWMFGGQGFDDKPTNEPRLLNDLWEFNTAKQTWSLVDDVDPTNIKEDSNHEGPIPHPRKLAASCGLKGLMFVIFGGEDTSGKVLNDTWVYNEPHSEWLILQYLPTLVGPSGRKDMAYWCILDKLVVFGGIDINGNSLQDMWEFSLRTLTWQQVQFKSDEQLPTARAGSLTWTGDSGMLYLYGGFTVADAGSLNGLLDLWAFNHTNSVWELKDNCGNTTHVVSTDNRNNHNPRSLFKQSGISIGRGCPGARRHGAAWVEIKGNLWMFGGEILPLRKVTSNSVPAATASDIHSSSWFMADLWRFDIENGMWKWMGSVKSAGMAAHYGTNYEPSATNHPGARCQMTTWTHKGRMFIYGGLGLDGRNKTAFLNDVWLVTHSDATYGFKVDRDWFRHIPPATVFIVTLGSFGGVVFAFGVGFYLKKMLESPNHNPSEFRVKYSRVRQDPFIDY